jgi:hypothetical protein
MIHEWGRTSRPTDVIFQRRFSDALSPNMCKSFRNKFSNRLHKHKFFYSEFATLQEEIIISFDTKAADCCEAVESRESDAKIYRN